MAVECQEASQPCGSCHLRERGICLSSSHQAVSEERERKQETVRASIRKIGCLLKSQTSGNNEKRKKKIRKSQTRQSQTCGVNQDRKLL